MGTLKIVFGLLVCVAPMASFAYEAGKWTTVAQIYSKNNGDIFVSFGANAMPGCYQDKGGYVKGTNIEKLYSTILAAFMAGKSVQPLYQIDASKTGWGLCYVEAVYLRN